MKCYIISGAPSPDIEFIRQTVPPDAFVICADKGYSYAKAASLTPQIAVGDFDSNGATPCEGEVISLDRDKDFTDTVHAIEIALRRGYTEIVLLAATGGRLDHTLGNLYALCYTSEHGGSAVILSPREEISLLTEGVHTFSDREGLTFSLFPFGCAASTVSVTGAHYPLSRYHMESAVPIGVSNVFEGDRCSITVYSGSLLCVINRDDRYLAI